MRKKKKRVELLIFMVESCLGILAIGGNIL